MSDGVSKIFCCSFGVWLWLAPPIFGSSATENSPAASQPSFSEYEVKAAFLYHFTKYFQWPEDDRSDLLTIAVLGKSEILDPLREIAREKTVGRKRLVVLQCSEVNEIGRPHILFIARSAVSQVPLVLEKARQGHSVTVGEAEGLGARGVAVNFVLREGSVKFEVNERALKEAQVQASSQLLRLAILVGEEKGSE